MACYMVRVAAFRERESLKAQDFQTPVPSESKNQAPWGIQEETFGELREQGLLELLRQRHSDLQVLEKKLKALRSQTHYWKKRG